MSRLTSAYIEGATLGRPAGFSEIIFQEVIPKYHEACKIHSLTEQIRIDLGKILFSMKDSTVDLDGWDILRLLERNLFSVSSFCFMRGNTDKHILSVDFLDLLEDKILDYKQTATKRDTDFLIQNKWNGLLLDQLRVDIRALESSYWAWFYDRDFVVPHVYSHILEDSAGGVKKLQNMKLMGDILNRLSSFVFWFNRDFCEKNYTSKTSVSEWSGQVQISV